MKVIVKQIWCWFWRLISVLRSAEFDCLYVAVVCVGPKLAQSYWTEFGQNNVHDTFILGQYRCTQIKFEILETNPSFGKNPNIFLSFMLERPGRSTPPSGSISSNLGFDVRTTSLKWKVWRKNDWNRFWSIRTKGDTFNHIYFNNANTEPL